MSEASDISFQRVFETCHNVRAHFDDAMLEITQHYLIPEEDTTKLDEIFCRLFIRVKQSGADPLRRALITEIKNNLPIES